MISFLECDFNLRRVNLTNQQWSVDFVAGRLEDGRLLRGLSVLDNFNR